MTGLDQAKANWLHARYQLISALGAMGEVWLAEDREAGRRVAAFDEALALVSAVHSFEAELQVRLRAAQFHLAAGSPARARHGLADAPQRARAAGFVIAAASAERLAEKITQKLATG